MSKEDDKEVSSVTTIKVFTDGSSETSVEDFGRPEVQPMCISVGPNPPIPPC